MNKPIYTDEFLKGKKFHALTYVSFSHKDKGNNSFCKWKCDCGNEIIANARDVVTGRKQSCPCFCYRKGNKNALWTGVGDMPGRYWKNVLANARWRKIQVNITKEDAWNLFLEQNRKCALTGELLIFESQWRAKDGTASLDRIDSSKPYVKGNIQWVHKDINNMKKGLSEDVFISWCRKIVDKA
jgi:hypothetical protein